MWWWVMTAACRWLNGGICNRKAQTLRPIVCPGLCQGGHQQDTLALRSACVLYLQSNAAGLIG